MNKQVTKKCDFCETEISNKLSQTKMGQTFCSYECMEAFYGDEIPEEEDFC